VSQTFARPNRNRLECKQVMAEHVLSPTPKIRSTRLPTDPDVTLKGICAAAVAADDRSSAAYDAVADISARDARYEKGVEASKLHYADCRAGMNFAALLPALTAGGMRAKAALALREIEPDAEEYPLVVSVLAQLAGRT